jgi:hypothetical protein
VTFFSLISGWCVSQYRMHRSHSFCVAAGSLARQSQETPGWLVLEILKSFVLPAIQASLSSGKLMLWQVRELRVVPQGAVSPLAAAIKVVNTSGVGTSGSMSGSDEFCLIVPLCPAGAATQLACQLESHT